MKRQAGFTLLELLVVMVLMGLMYTLVPPMFTSGGGAELRAAARQLAAGLRKTRNQAIISRQEAVLTVDVAARQFRVAGDARQFTLPREAQVNVFTAKSEAVDDKVAAIRFYPDGSSTGGGITLVNGGRQFRVDVDWLTGNVTLLD